MTSSLVDNSKPGLLFHWAIRVGNHLYEGRRGDDGKIVFCTYEVDSDDWKANQWDNMHIPTSKWLLNGTTHLPHHQIVGHGYRIQQRNEGKYNVIINNCHNFAKCLFKALCPDGYFPKLPLRDVAVGATGVTVACRAITGVTDYFVEKACERMREQVAYFVNYESELGTITRRLEYSN